MTKGLKNLIFMEKRRDFTTEGTEATEILLPLLEGSWGDLTGPPKQVITTIHNRTYILEERITGSHQDKQDSPNNDP